MMRYYQRREKMGESTAIDWHLRRQPFLRPAIRKLNSRVETISFFGLPKSQTNRTHNKKRNDQIVGNALACMFLITSYHHDHHSFGQRRHLCVHNRHRCEKPQGHSFVARMRRPRYSCIILQRTNARARQCKGAVRTIKWNKSDANIQINSCIDDKSSNTIY